MLRILEQKGYARHEKVGRAFAYVPVLGREQARRTAVQRLVSQLFDDSPGSLALNIIENEEVDGVALEALRARIEGLQ
jgi:predicted transcriptional regulator